MAVKKFYLSAAAAAVSPTIPSGYWEDTTSSTALAMTDAPSGTNAAVARAETSSSGSYDVLLRRWVSPPIQRAGTLEADPSFGSGYFALLVNAVQVSNSIANFASSIRIFVVTDTGAVRGTFMATSGGSFWSTTLTGKLETAPASVTSPVAVQPGDRVVLEFGYQARNTVTTSMTGTIRVGGTATTDLASGDTGTNAQTRPPSITFTGPNSSDLWEPTSTEHQGAASLLSSTTLAAGARQDNAAAAALDSSTTLTATGTPDRRAAAALSTTTTLTANAARVQPAAAALGSTTTLTATGTPVRAAAAALTSATVLTAQAGQQASAALTSTTVLAVAAQQQHSAQAALSSVTTLTAGVRQTHQVAAAIASTTTLAAAATRGLPAAAALSSSTELSAAGTRVKLGSAQLSSTTTLAVGSIIRSAMAAAALVSSTMLTARAGVSSGGMLNPSLWAKDPVTGRLIPLPHPVKLAVTDLANDVGSIDVEYPVYGRGFDLLSGNVTDQRDLEVEVWTEGARATRMVGWLNQRQGDDVTEHAVWSFSGVLVTARLGETVVAPQPVVGETTLGPDVEVAKTSVTAAQWNRLYALGYRTSDTDTTTVRVPQKVIDAVKANAVAIPVLADPKREAKFESATPGAIMLFLLGQSWARGAVTDLTIDFTGAKDSAGVAWPEVLTAKWSPGVTLLQVAQRLVELGLMEFTVTPDRVLRCWRFGGRGTDRTGGPRPVTLRRGQNLLQAGRRQGVRGAGTDFYVAGGDGAYTTSTDLNARARRGRLVEVSDSVGNITDPSALTAAAQRIRAAGTRGEDERSLTLALGVGAPRPNRTINVGDQVRVDTAGVLGVERIAQWTITAEPQGVTADVVAGDLIRSRAAALLKRLADAQGGETVIGTSTSPQDRGVPAAPTGVVVTSRAYTEGTDAYAAVTAGCAPVEVNTDGTAATDLDSYDWQWRPEAEPDVWQSGATTAGPTGSWTTGIAQPIRVRVRAKDRSGNRSDWSTEVQHLTDDAVTPPPVPSGLTGQAWLGNSIRWTWDGKTADGGDMLAVFPRFDHVELRMGPSADVADSTLIERLYAGTTWTVNNLPDGVRQYAWLVAVERSGLRSDPSTRADALPRRLVSLDFGPDSVDRAAIKALAVGTLELDDGAVNSLKVSSLSVALLTGGVLSADVVMGGSFLTGTTGRRMRFGAEGLQMWNAQDQVVVAFRTADGSSLVTGQQQSALAGKRIVINWGSSNPDEIRFYGSNTNQYATLRTVASSSTNYPDQTGMTMRAFSARNDGYAGFLNVFPDYVSLEWGLNYLQLVPDTAGIRAPRIHLGMPRGTGFAAAGDDETLRIGVSSLSSGQYLAATIMQYRLDANDQPSWCAPGQNAQLSFRSATLACTNGDGTAWIPIRASAFTQMTSLRSTKQDFAPLDYDGGPLGALRRAPVEKWRRITEVELDGDLAEIHIGPMADDLPPEVVRFDIGPGGSTGYDVNSHLGLVHAGVNQLADTVDDLLARIEALEAARA